MTAIVLIRDPRLVLLQGFCHFLQGLFVVAEVDAVGSNIFLLQSLIAGVRVFTGLAACHLFPDINRAFLADVGIYINAQCAKHLAQAQLVDLPGQPFTVCHAGPEAEDERDR